MDSSQKKLWRVIFLRLTLWLVYKRVESLHEGDKSLDIKSEYFNNYGVTLLNSGMYKEANFIFEKAVESLVYIEDAKHRKVMEQTVKFNKALLAETSCINLEAKSLYRELIQINPLFQGKIYDISFLKS